MERLCIAQVDVGCSALLLRVTCGTCRTDDKSSRMEIYKIHGAQKSKLSSPLREQHKAWNLVSLYSVLISYLMLHTANRWWVSWPSNAENNASGRSTLCLMFLRSCPLVLSFLAVQQPFSPIIASLVESAKNISTCSSSLAVRQLLVPISALDP